MPASGQASERTRIQLCGRLSVQVDGVELVPSLRGRQVPLLLAYLVLHRERTVGRDELSVAIWPSSAPRAQDAALRTLLSRLRSGLGAAALVGRDELTLALPEPAWVDHEAASIEMRNAGEALRRDDPSAAWALAQVPLNIASRGLLPGVQADWLEPHRRELADVRLRALELIGWAGLALGGPQLASVERAGRALIDTEPYRESGYVLLMRALEAQGNVAEGLRAFERLRGLLREELGTSPSPDALAAHERLLHPVAARPATGSAAPDPDDSLLELPAELAATAATPLIGRHDELDALQEWWERPGAPRLAMLAGEAGIGKSRLLGELAGRAHSTGAVVLAGRSPEETLVPYQPFLEALGHYALHAPLEELRAATRRAGPELAQLVTEIDRRLPGLGSPEPSDPETERYRLFEAVATMLGDIAARRPLLLVLDDLHWADRPTLLLLRHLARTPQAAELRIVAAHRTGERAGEGLGNALGTMRHQRLTLELDVAGLPEGDATELVRWLALDTPSAAFIQALYAGTAGNPFFIEEIVRHLADSGVRSAEAGASELDRIGLPEGVRGVIARRLERLGQDGLECLRAAAVIGRDFDTALLEELTGWSEERFLRALEEALDAGLVIEAPGELGRGSFAHALVRETLYAGMSSDRRRRLHRRVGTALELRGGAPPGALALHFARAGAPEDAERAIRYALAAGEQATEMVANEEAADHYARALEVLERVAPDAVPRRCELLLHLGEARVRSGERGAAWPVFREAASLAAGLGDGEHLARAAIGASRRFIQPAGVVDDELIGLLEQALAMVPEQQLMTRVRVSSRLCVALYYSPERRDRMRRLSAEATALAAQLGDPEAAAMAAAARRRAYWAPGHLERRLADSTQLLRAAREAGDADLTLQGHAWLLCDLLETGDRTAVEAQLAAFASGAERLRQPVFLWTLTVWRAMLALLDGRLEEAERLSTDAVSTGILPEDVTAPQYHAVQLLGIRREQARIGELEGPTRALIAANGERPAWSAGLTTLLAESGRLEEARSELERLLAGVDSIPRDGDWLISISLLADVAADVGDGPAAATLYELLAPHAESNVIVGHAAVCLGPVHRLLGRLALLGGRGELAVRHARRAVDACVALRSPVLLAHARLDLADALGPGPEARALVAQAAAIGSELELARVARRAEAFGERTPV